MNALLILLLCILGGLVLYSLIPLAHSSQTMRDLGRLRVWLSRKFAFVTRYGTELGGYVHDAGLYVWIPFSQFVHTAGTWTATVASNVWYSRRTAADAAATTMIPLGNLLAHANGAMGVYVKAITVYFRIGTAVLDAMEAHLYKGTLAADGTLFTVAEVTTTYDTGHDTAGERVDVDEHNMTLTPSTPFWIDGDGAFYWLEIVWDGSATGVIDLFGANVSVTMQL